MSGADKNAASVSGVISMGVRTEAVQDFDIWLEEIGRDVEQFVGFQARDIARSKPRGTVVPVSVLLFFDNSANLRRWEASDERAAHLHRAKELNLFAKPDQVAIEVRAEDDEPTRWVTSASGPTDAAAKPLPPPKWRLVCVTWFCVFTSVYTLEGAEVMPNMLKTGWIPFEVALLLILFLVVSIIIYGYSELVINLPLGPLSISRWLKSPRLDISVHSAAGGTSAPLRVVASAVCSCLTDGCGCCNPPPPPPPPASLLRRLERAEGRLEALRRHQHKAIRAQSGADGGRARIHAQLAADPSSPGHGELERQRTEVRETTNTLLGELEPAGKSGTPVGDGEPITVAVHHRVKWECEDEYADWCKLMTAKMKGFDGFVSVRTVKPESTLEEANDPVCLFPPNAIPTDSRLFHQSISRPKHPIQRPTADLPWPGARRDLSVPFFTDAAGMAVLRRARGDALAAPADAAKPRSVHRQPRSCTSRRFH